MDRAELGATLRTWRERLHPADVGLPALQRRRTPGLRREEVAMLAGVSVDYLTRLEQGRGPNPSDGVLAALARALRTSDVERDYLYRVAGAPVPGPGLIRSTVRASVLRLLDRLDDVAVVVLDATTEVVAWNALGSALLGDLSVVDRNTARRRFLGGGREGADPAERERLDRALVSDLRRSAARYPDDPRLAGLVGDLCAGSADFGRLWASRGIEERHADTKTLHHPQLGPLELDCDAMYLPADDQVVLVYSAAPGTPGAASLELLGVIGLQDLTSPA